jgi:hypothetical protein
VELCGSPQCSDGLLEQRHQFIARRLAQFSLQRSHIGDGLKVPNDD